MRLHYDEALPVAERKPACVMACPASARLFGDVHDPDSKILQAIRERGGYTLMPELGTLPANHYQPRRRTEARTDPIQIVRQDNPLRVEGREPQRIVDLPVAGSSGAPLLPADWEN